MTRGYNGPRRAGLDLIPHISSVWRAPAKDVKKSGRWVSPAAVRLQSNQVKSYKLNWSNQRNENLNFHACFGTRPINATTVLTIRADPFERTIQSLVDRGVSVPPPTALVQMRHMCSEAISSYKSAHVTLQKAIATHEKFAMASSNETHVSSVVTHLRLPPHQTVTGVPDVMGDERIVAAMASSEKDIASARTCACMKSGAARALAVSGGGREGSRACSGRERREGGRAGRRVRAGRTTASIYVHRGPYYVLPRGGSGREQQMGGRAGGSQSGRGARTAIHYFPEGGRAQYDRIWMMAGRHVPADLRSSQNMMRQQRRVAAGRRQQ
ncbi:hypothetical protein B0H11DRAFT_1943912 [Mycena galericulata]|nr:hypothetical protein B0H11DRAFT_1943912 [Mycena galericulata]